MKISSSVYIIKSSSEESDLMPINEFKEKDIKLPQKLLTYSSIKNNSQIKFPNKSEFLKSRKWKYIYEEEINLIEEKYKLIEKDINKEKYEKLLNDIKQSNLKDAFEKKNSFEKKNIGTLNSLEYLIKNMYDFSLFQKEEMKSDMMQLKQIVCKYREIKSDGNSFYRSLIFNFLENVIFSKNKFLLKELLIIFQEKINENNDIIKQKEYIISSLKKIDKEKMIYILYIIIQYLDKIINGNEMTPYIILLKVFLYCDEFDEGIIFLTRYLLYEYISENKDKFLSQDKIIKLIEFIPEKYQKNLDEFYKDIMTLGCEAINDKIYSYIVPYVFNCDLNVLIYFPDPHETIINTLEYKSEKHNEYEINLLFNKNNFDIFYKSYFYDKYYQDLNVLIDKNDDIIFISNESNNNKILLDNISANKSFGRRISSPYPTKKDIKLKLSASKALDNDEQQNRKYKLQCSENLNNNKSNIPNKYIAQNKFATLNEKKEKKEKKEKNINDMKKMDNRCSKRNCYNLITKENIMNLCQNCTINELKSYILQNYLTYLQQDDHDINFKKYFSKVECEIEGKKILLMKLIQDCELNFEDLFLKLKEIICLWCGKNIDENIVYIKLPCNCNICSKKCFEKYVKLIEEKNEEVTLKGRNNEDNEIVIIPMTECPCGYEYKLKDFIDMMKILEDKKLNSYLNIYENQIKNNWIWMCMCCREIFSKKNKNLRIYFRNDNMDKYISNKIKLRHLICQKCAEKNNINENGNKIIKCEFCNAEHEIELIKNVDDNNKTDSQCIII